MNIFQVPPTIDELNSWSANTLVQHLGIKFTGVGEDYLEAKMPVDHRTHQPIGALHGGASVALAETMGSMGAMCCLDRTKQYCVGLEINANHIKGVRDGFVRGIAKPVHIGKKTQVWEIRITDDADNLVCISRITLAVLDNR
jgi:1,4-dihydroxy-2-naphthoyl-CoA hydrolase